MFEKLSNFLGSKFARKDDLSKQLEIVNVFDIYREEVKKNLPQNEGVNPISLRNKVLTVEVPSSVAASELRLREGSILEEINSKLRKEAVERIIYQF